MNHEAQRARNLCPLSHRDEFYKNSKIDCRYARVDTQRRVFMTQYIPFLKNVSESGNRFRIEITAV